MADGGSLSAKELRQAHGGINLTANVDLSKVLNLSNTLQRMISNKNLQKYWKNTEDLIQDVSKACNTYKTNLDKISATELIKTVNALTAKSPTFDITEFANQFEDFEDILSTISKIDLGNLGLDEAFSVKSFQETFSTFDLLRSEGLNMMSFFKAMAHDKSVAELERQLEESRLKNIDLNQSLENTKQELNDLSRSTGFSALKDELDDLQGKLYNLTHSAEREFSNFLDANGFDAHFFKNYDPEDDWFYGDDSSIPRVAGRAKEYFDEISAGSMTAKEAIANFRSEFNNLLLSSYRNTDGSFGADQIEVFADRLSKIFTQVEEISTKINDIMTNGVMSRGSLPGELPEGYAEGIQDYSSIIQMISDIIKSSEEIGDGSSDLYKSLAEVLSTIERIANIDISNLSEVYSVINAIGKLDDIKIDKTPLENLMNALERLSQFENTSPLISMSAVDFSKFNDLHISKASLANLAEYLPRIADINPNNLIELTKIDFNGLNGLKIDKESMKNLMSFIDGLKTALGASGTGNPLEGFVEANKGVEKSADDSKSELQAEADLMKSIAENARKAADAKKEFVEANKKVEKSASDSISSLDKENSSFEDILPNDKKFKSVLNSLDLTKSKISEIAKVTRQAYADENGKFIESFVIKGKDGSTETYGASSHTQKGQLLRYNYVEYDTSTEKKAELKIQKELLQASREAWEINDIINRTNKSFENLEVNPALINDLTDVKSKLFQLNQEFANGKISLPVYESRVESIIDLYNEQLEVQKNLVDEANRDWNAVTNTQDRMSGVIKPPDNSTLSKNYNDLYSTVSKLNEELLDGNILLPDYTEQVDKLFSEYEKLKKIQQKRDYEEYEDEVRGVAAYEQKANDAQRKKWQSFLDEQQTHTDKEAIERQNSAYEELTSTIQRYAVVQKRISGNQALDGDYELATKLEEKILELQNSGILSSSQIAKSERELEKLFDILDDIEKKSSQDLKVEHDKDIQNEWKKNVAAIQEYLDAQSKLNSLKAKDRRTGKYENKILDQEKAVDSLREKAEEARAALSSMIGSSPVPLDDWNKWLDAMEKFRQATVGSTESVAKLKDSFKSEFTKFQTSFTKYSTSKPEETDRTLKYQRALDDYQSKLKELSDQYDIIKAKDIISSEDVKKWIKLTSAVEEAEKAVKSFSSAEKGSSTLSRAKEIDKITKYLDKNTRISTEARVKLNEYLELLKSKNSLVNLEKIHTEFLSITAAERMAGREGKNFIDIITDKATYGIAAQIGQMFSFYDFINYLREGITVVKDFDSALTEMRKVSDETVESLKNYQETSFDLAENIGSTALAIQNSTADFMRLGYVLDEASDLGIDATIYSNVGDMEIDEATSHMISSIQAWKSEFETVSDASTGIIDRYNEVGNRFAITSADIGSAMTRSAAALKAAGNSLNESIGIITAGNLIQQDADTTANALKILSLRIRGAKSELEAMGEEADDLVSSTSKMRGDLKALTGVDIMLDENTFKSTTQIIQELGKEWENFSDITRANALEMLAGKNRASTISGLIENYEVIEEVIKACEEAEGSAREENEKFLDSIQGRINLLSNQATELWTKVIDDEALKDGIDLLTDFLKIVTDLVDSLGLLGTLSVGGSAFAGFKNYGLLQVSNGKIGLGDLFKSSKVDVNQYTDLINRFKGLELGKTFYKTGNDGKSIFKFDELLNALDVKELDDHFVSYVAHLKDGTGAINNHNASTKDMAEYLNRAGRSFDFAALKANLLNGALNAGVGLAITFAVQGIATLIDYIHVSREELEEAAQESASELSEAQSKLQSVNDELESTSQKINEILSKDKVELADEEELKKLQDQNDELERERRLLEYNAKLKKQEASDSATALFTNKSKQTKYFWDENNNLSWYEERGTDLEAALTNLEQVLITQAEIDQLQNSQDSFTVGSDKYIELQDEIDRKSKGLEIIRESLDDSVELFMENDDNLVRGISEETDAVLDQLESFYEEYDKLISYDNVEPPTIVGQLNKKYGVSSRDVFEGYSPTSGSDEFISKWINSLTEEQKKALLASDVTIEALRDAAQKDLAETENIVSDTRQRLVDARENISNELAKIDEWVPDYKDDIVNGTLQSKFGNVDMDKRIIIEWSDELKETYRKELESWDYNPEVGGIDTVFGGSQAFGINDEEVEIAFTPIMNVDDEAIFLGKETVLNYISRILELANADGKWSIDEILSLDAEGLSTEVYEDGKVVGTQLVQGLIAGVGEGSENNAGAIDVGNLLHFAGSFGAWQLAQDELAAAQNGVNELDNSFEHLNGTLEKTERQAKEAVESMTVSGAVSQVNTQLKPQLDALGEAYKEIFYGDNGFSHDAVDTDMLESLRATFLDVSEEMKEAGLEALPTESIDKFLDTLADVNATSDEVQDEFDRIATQWIYNTDVLYDLNDATAQSTIKMLEEMGVVNANEVITNQLAASRMYLAETGEDLADASNENAFAFLTEKVAAGELSKEMIMLELKKRLVNGTLLNTDQDVSEVLTLAEAAGIASFAFSTLAEAKANFDKAVQGGNSLEITQAAAAYQTARRQVETEIANFKPFEVDHFVPPPSDAGSAGKETADAYVESFEKELKTLETLKDQGKITEKEYLDYLRQLYERYFKDREEYLDKYKEYEDKYLRGKIYAPFYSNVDYKK